MLQFQINARNFGNKLVSTAFLKLETEIWDCQVSQQEEKISLLHNLSFEDRNVKGWVYSLFVNGFDFQLKFRRVFNFRLQKQPQNIPTAKENRNDPPVMVPMTIACDFLVDCPLHIPELKSKPIPLVFHS